MLLSFLLLLYNFTAISINRRGRCLLIIIRNIYIYIRQPPLDEPPFVSLFKFFFLLLLLKNYTHTLLAASVSHVKPCL